MCKRFSDRIVLLCASLAFGARVLAAQAAPGPGYSVVWNLDAAKARAAGGEILIPIPSDEPYQKVRWEVTGARSQRVVQVEGGAWSPCDLKGIPSASA